MSGFANPDGSVGSVHEDPGETSDNRRDRPFKLPQTFLDNTVAYDAYCTMVKELADNLAGTLVPHGLYFDNEKVALLRDLLAQNHVEIADECFLMIRDTRRKYINVIMGVPMRSFENTTKDHELDLGLGFIMQRNRPQAWARMLGYEGQYPLDTEVNRKMFYA
ncbi:MAG: hypothetical protein LQ351_004126 [Letrouitia transgressa]|nr:MAG: hypothetical protein LQ351_004126 [Letrouitia transgressa]